MNVQRLSDDVFSTVMRGSRDEYGSWNTICICLHVRDVFCRDGFSVKDHLAARRLIEPQNRASDGRFAAAGLANQTQRLAAADGKRNVVDCLEGIVFISPAGRGNTALNS